MTLTARPRLLIRFAVLAALALCGVVLALSSTGTPPVGAQDGSVPAKPTGVVATATHDSVALAWDDPGDASITHYQIFRRDRDVHDTGEFVTIKENTGSAAASYTDDTVEPETRYVYRVKAVNAHGASHWSDYRRANTPAAPDPADLAPSGLEVSLVENRVTLTWDAPASDAASVTGYEILRRRPNEGEAALTTLVADTGNAETGYTDDTANEPGVRYTYRVKALRDGEQSRVSNYARIDLPDDYAQDTPEPAPEPEEEPSPEALAPSGLTAEAAEDGGVALSWTAPAEDAGSVTGYEVLRAQGNAELTTLEADTGSTDTAYTDETDTGSTDTAYTDEADTGSTDTAYTDETDTGSTDTAYTDETDTGSTDTAYTDETDTAAGETYAYQVKALRGGDASQGSNVAGVLQSALADVTLVSNTGQPEGSTTAAVYEMAQGFQTGTNTGGYSLSEIVVGINTTGSGTARVTLYSSSTTDPATAEPSASLAVMTDVTYTSGTTDFVSFTAPANTTLSASTIYFVVLEEESGGGLRVRRTSPDEFGEDADAAAGWSITDRRLFKATSGANWSASNRIVMIQVKGSASTSTNNAATGAPTITGTAQVGEQLTADTSNIGDPDGIDNADFEYQWIAFDGTTDSDISGATGETYRPQAKHVGQTIKVRVSFDDDNDNAESLTSAATAAVAGVPVTEVPSTWGLIPSGLSGGDSFRLLFVSSTTRDATSSSIEDYDTHVQNAAANGHADIQAYSAQFKALGSTEAVDARDNTGTTYTSSDEGVPIYYLNGAKVADDYGDFYDGGWDSNLPRTEAGDTLSSTATEVWTGSKENGRELSETIFDNVQSVALGASAGLPFSGFGRADISSQSLSQGTGAQSALKLLYGLSGVFEVVAANSPATGAPVITGTAQVGELLTADTSNIGDPDGIDNADFEYQWIAFDGTTDSDISGATGETYRPLLAHLAQTIKVRVSFDDDEDNAESLTSAATATVSASTYGQVIWAGTLTVEEDTVSAGTFFGYALFSDRGSLEPVGFTYDGVAILVTGLQYLEGRLRFDLNVALGSEDFNLYLDGAPFLIESPGTDIGLSFEDHGLTWTDEQMVEVRLTVNRPATGAPAITGTPEVGETLTADISGIMDEDGVPAADQFTYQWISDDSDIDGATDSTYTLVEADAGKTIKVRVSFTDNAKFPESLTSAAPNSPATAGPTITGFPQLGKTLTADASTIVDPDGTTGATFTYQWVRSRDGTDTDIAGATATTYTLVEADVGKLIKVEVSYTDGGGADETATSEPVGPVGRRVIDSAGNVDAKGVWFESVAGGGFIIRLSDDEDDHVYGYTTGPFTYSPSHGFDLHADNGDAQGIAAADGVLYVADSGDDKLFAYNVGATGTFGERLTSKEFALHADNQEPAGVWTDGETLYVVDPDEDKLYAYNVGATGTFGASLTDEDVALHADNNDPWGVWATGTVIWVADRSDYFIYAYSLSADGARLDAELYRWEWSLDTPDGNTDPWGMWSNDDTLWVLDGFGSKLFAYYLPLPSEPDPPTDAEIDSHGDGELTVEWGAPTDDGGTAITGYKVQWKSGSESFGSARQHTTVDGSARSYKITMLTNGTEYTVRVLAVNAEDDSDASNTDTGTPSTTPSDPTNVQASGNAELVVTWDVPNNGGSAITGYTVQWKSGPQSYNTSRQATVTTTTHTIPSLTNGTTYTVRVKATNANGDSGWTEITATPVSGPSVGTVTSGSITKTSAVITVTISNPDTNTQTVNLQYKRNADTNWTSGGTRSTVSAAVTFTLSSLTGNTDYDVRASLDSTFDSGVVTATFKTSPTAPGQTRAVSVNFTADGQVSIIWQEPLDDGGSAITGYTVQWKSGSQSFGDPSREHTTGASARIYLIGGLTNGTEYTVRVIAVNAVGDGPPSNTTTGTPVGPPDAPGNVQASGNAELTVTWDAPNDRGGAITEYTVQLKLSSVSGWPSGSVTERTLTGTPPARSHTFTGLTNGTEYTVRVKAANAIDNSDWSAEAGGTPSSKPPPSVTITTGADQPIDGPFAVTITFNEEVEGFACADEPPDPNEVACDIGAGYVGGALVDVMDLQEAGVNANGEHVFTARVEDILTGTLTVSVRKGKARAVDGGLPNAFGALQVEVKALDHVPQQPVTTVWQASMDVEDVGGYLGYGKAGGHSGGSLTGDTFSWSGQEYTVETLLYNQAIGEVILELSRALPNDGRRMALLIGNYWLDTSNPEPYTHTVAGKDGWGYQWHPVAPYLEAGHANVTVKLVRQAIGASSAQGEAFLSWGDPGDDTITGYRIERRDRDGDEGFTALVDDTGSDDTGYTDRSVEGGGRYAYRVTAMNDAGESEPSGEAHVDVPARPNSAARGAPTISGTAQAGETLTADTDGIEDDDGLANAVYSYQWLADGADISGATGDTYTLVADDQGKVIRVKVSFIDDRDFEETLTSEPTEEVAADPDAPTEPPNAPRTVRIVGDTNTSLTLTWDAPEGGPSVTEYRVQWITVGENFATARRDGREAVLGASARSHTITGLSTGEFYQVRVLAVNGAGESEGSNTAWGFPGLGEDQYRHG